MKELSRLRPPHHLAASPLFLLLLQLLSGGAPAQDSSWDSRFGPPAVCYPDTLTVCGGKVYICVNSGGFCGVGGIFAWNGSQWSAGVGDYEGEAGGETLVATTGTDFYLAPVADTAGLGIGDGNNHIAKWNGTNWSSMGRIEGVWSSSSSVSINALVASGGNIYIGGCFTSVAGVPVSGIAKWDGTNWSSLGGGVSSTNFYAPQVNVIILGNNGDLYAGGYFTSAGGVPTLNIARWDGTNWSSLGSGLNGLSGGCQPRTRGPVLALAIKGKDLYAGGDITSAGGLPANYIAKWNGGVWTPMGSGIGGTGFC